MLIKKGPNRSPTIFIALTNAGGIEGGGGEERRGVGTTIFSENFECYLCLYS